MARRSPSRTRRRALELLASSRDGATEAIMSAFTVEQMVELGRAGLATAASRFEVARLRRWSRDA
jgi:hypothetical protein